MRCVGKRQPSEPGRGRCGGLICVAELAHLTRTYFCAGQTALHLAAARDQGHLVDLLLTARANPNARTSVEGE